MVRVQKPLVRLGQTDGREYEPEPIPGRDADTALSMLGIERAAFTMMDGNIQGFARKREVAINPVAEQPESTLFHELAHIVLGHTAEGSVNSDSKDRTPRDIRELEAECVALLCCESLGASWRRGVTWLYSILVCRSGSSRAYRAANLSRGRSDPEGRTDGQELGGHSMSASIRTHRSTAYVRPINERGRTWKPDPITNQFRFIMRMAYACHERDVPYVLTWGHADGVMSATILATGDIPMPKPLPKAIRLKVVANWKPSIWEAVYRLDAYHDVNLKRRCPGFVIEHSCGLSLLHPSDSDELGGDNADIRQNWRVTHTGSGLGFGLTLNFKRATDALRLATTFPVDWTQDVSTLKANPEFQRAGSVVLATYGKGYERESAKRRMAEMGQAA